MDRRVVGAEIHRVFAAIQRFIDKPLLLECDAEIVEDLNQIRLKFQRPAKGGNGTVQIHFRKQGISEAGGGGGIPRVQLKSAPIRISTGIPQSQRTEGVAGGQLRWSVIVPRLGDLNVSLQRLFAPPAAIEGIGEIDLRFD